MEASHQPVSTEWQSLQDDVLHHTEVGSAPLVPEIRIRLLRDESSLWRAFGDQPDAADTPRPYWAFAWSGGQALARYLLDHPHLFVGRQVLDFGSGCGIAAVAAKRAGAEQVTAADVCPMAAAAAGVNAAMNHVELTTVIQDLIYTDNPGWDVVLAGDIWYDTRLARHGLRWLKGLAAENVLVLSADPGRHYTPSQGMEWLATYSARSVPDLEHANLQEVQVCRILPE